MSKVSIKTEVFKDMVSRAAKGAGRDKLIPITSMIELNLSSEGVLSLTTITQNTLVISQDGLKGDPFRVVVDVDLFSKLIAKITSPDISLRIHKDNLEVSGNGNYTIPVIVDEDGIVQFPKTKEVKPIWTSSITLSEVKNILSTNKAATLKMASRDRSCLTGYYLGDYVITTDEEVVCCNELKLFNDDVLISSSMMELLALSPSEEIKVEYDNGYFRFSTNNFVLCGYEEDGIEFYPAQECLEYLNTKFTGRCKLPKDILKNVIDRLALFIEPYDQNGAYFTFKTNTVEISSKKESSSEFIGYLPTEDNVIVPYKCCVDIPMLKKQLDSISEDAITISYGDENALRIDSGKVSQVLALLEDDSLGVSDTE